MWSQEISIKEIETLPQTQTLYPTNFATWGFKPLIFQTYFIWSNMIDSLKYLSFSDIVIKKSEFVAKT